MSFSVGRRFSAAPRRAASAAGGDVARKPSAAHSTDARLGDNALRNTAP